ncbi:Mam33p KNAG_0C04240 [Huiozyma naganishii CBS 8797]|uniref:Mitochondrial acidic protein MAM33 n=1 Tax=Huiozyma naganishii (strain ATCC MYA-139 / BCRC 22969 / CBS 8797 / KCTC 17520 / NBRC 10181 / NCYC 3082 / Yp74L-3) TaxID=1071383 RepID=J7S648_HUIN7|nr:hypothetical protein KNAG_0C04240 [Kazachstania naganishii CBS 8797]CCK69526.1 hypothetical protein KNAG_0C04240 [Kazachstania naganishii CBS 8797]
MFLSVLRRAATKTPVCAITRTTAVSQSLKRLTVTSAPVRTFLTTQVRGDQQRQNVSDILKSEIKVETESFSDEVPALFKDYLTKYKFDVVENKGQNEAQIVRKTDNGETVRVFFDVAQVANLPFDEAPVEENLADDDAGEEDFDSMADNFANVNVVVAKESDGSALSFDLLMNLQDRSFFVDSITPYTSAELALDDTAEAQVKKDAVYHGPPFSNLDEELQETLEIYLESRGINEELASFISAYSEFKEGAEYVSWLQNMKRFFD